MFEPMAYPAYIRERARELRVTKKLTLDEIAERLVLPKTTVWYWIRDLPLGRPRRASAAQRQGNTSMREKYRQRREEAYGRGRIEYDALNTVATFRDFVVLYIAEGYKRDRNVVSICNSDPAIVALAQGWVRRLSDREPIIRVHYHADQDVEELRDFWGATLSIEPATVRVHRKSNSGSLQGRSWRCVHGVASVTVYDTMLRARLQAWIDRVSEAWGLHSAI
jgi:hypothetical protein